MQHFNGVTVLLWCYCGASEEYFIEDATSIQEYAVVRPICFLYQSEGMKQFVKMQTNDVTVLVCNNHGP